MMELDPISTLDPSVMKLIIALAFGLISLMGIAIVMLFSSNQKRNDETLSANQKRNDETFTLLQQTVSSVAELLAKTIVRIEHVEHQAKSDDASCQVHHKHIDDRFNSHSTKIENLKHKVSVHDIDISVLKEKIK